MELKLFCRMGRINKVKVIIDAVYKETDSKEALWRIHNLIYSELFVGMIVYK